MESTSPTNSNHSGDKSEFNCPICYQSTTITSKVILHTDSNHHLCQTCYDKLLAVSNLCPFCCQIIASSSGHTTTPLTSPLNSDSEEEDDSNPDLSDFSFDSDEADTELFRQLDEFQSFLQSIIDNTE